MNHTASIRQLLHKQTRATGVIKMYVREKNVVDVGNVEVLLMQGIDQ
jgi:hypothetical protein